MNTIDEISTLLQQGRAPKVQAMVAQAIAEGCEPKKFWRRVCLPE